MNQKLLSPDQLENLMTELPAWMLEEASHRIERTFEFSNYYETMAFVNAAAYVAHQQDHHPEMTVGYKTCRVSYTTHSAGGLTSLDFHAAHALDGLLSSEPSKD
jgi:4a-hydroxytetrahydrobiopterin dehydratase